MPEAEHLSTTHRLHALSLHSIACSQLFRKELSASWTGSHTPVLLVGEEGSGKHYIARRLAAAMLCDAPDPETGACGQCASCRTLLQGSHPDLIELEPLEDKTSIPVASVREEVSATLPVYPQISRHRVYVISAAKSDTLTEQGQNALLKPLEEHPDFVRFILLTEDAGRLLPTILSRSRVIRIGRRDDEAILNLLRDAGYEGEIGDLAVRYADGLPGRALTIAGDEDFRALRDQTVAIFRQLPEATRAYCLTEGLQFFRDHKARVAVILRILESLLRDLLVLLQNGDGAVLVNRDLSSVFLAMRGRANEMDPAMAGELIRQTNHALSNNTNFDHTMARLLLGLRAFLGPKTDARDTFRLKAAIV